MGTNGYGQLGNGTTTGTNQPGLILASNVTAIAAGDAHSLFIKSDGSLWDMGYGGNGQLGDNNYNNVTTSPVLILSSNCVAIAGGHNHSLFLKSDGSLWGMGNNYNGQLGSDADTTVAYPVQIVASNVTALAAESESSASLFLKSDGSLWGVGFNSYGGLGDGIYNNSAPYGTNQLQKIVPSGVTAIASGGGHSLFLKSDGSLWAMGWNNYGQLGDGTIKNTNVPEQIVPGNVVAVAAGGSHSLFIKSDGSLWAMGYNGFGQLGDGTTNGGNYYTNRPEEIVTSGVVAVAAGGNHSLFTRSDGSLWAMGYNGYGQLGDANYNNANQPVQVFFPLIVSNGGFETGNLSGWTANPSYAAGVQTFAAHSGNYGATTDNSFGSHGYLSQTLPTTANASYLLSFWLSAVLQGPSPSQFNPNEFLVSWNGTIIFDQVNWSGTTGWTNLQFLVKATGTNTVLQFGYEFNYNPVYLDDINVTANSFVAISPNPGSGIVPLTVQFNAPNTDNYGNAILTWNWDFGDGSTSATQNPSHSYNVSGNFSPNLLMTNNFGNLVVGVCPMIDVFPPNDNFTNSISLSGSSLGNNSGATLERNEPNPAGTNNVTNSVWWSWKAPTNGLASVLTSGSAFDTIIDVYTGNALTNLVCIASNLNTVLNNDLYYQNPNQVNYSPVNALITNRVGFMAMAGTNYQIQVSGFSQGQINIAVQSVALKILSVNQVLTNADSSVNFNAVVEVGDSGSALPAQLRLVILSRAGYSYNANLSYPPTNSIPSDQVLATYYLANPSNVAPGTTTNVAISGVCPGPQYGPSNYGGPGYGFGFGVYAVLQEQFGTNWFFCDNDLIFYGQWPVVSGQTGPAAGVIRLNPSEGGSTPVYQSAAVFGSTLVNQNSKTNYFGTATFSDGQNNYYVNFTNTQWNATKFSITNGLLQTGGVTTNTPVTLTAYYAYDFLGRSLTNSTQLQVTVLRTPVPSFSSPQFLTNLNFIFTLNTLPTNKYAIEMTTNLVNPHWVFMATNVTDANGIWVYKDTAATNRGQRFYRAFQTP